MANEKPEGAEGEGTSGAGPSGAGPAGPRRDPDDPTATAAVPEAGAERPAPDPLEPAETAQVSPVAAPWRADADPAPLDRAEERAAVPGAPLGSREEPAPAAAEHSEEEAAEEERGWSFAARALTFLIVLLAGAALGIWAAPRVAPHLPAGLAPVAAWLTPGASEAEARIAALEARVEGELSALGGRVDGLPDAAAVTASAESAVAAARQEIAGEIDALRQELAQAAGGDAGARIGTLETAVAGATGELAALRGQIEAGGVGAAAQEGIDTYRAELEGLKAEVQRLAGEVSGLAGRVEAAEGEFEARASAAVAEAEQAQSAAAAERDVAAARADVAAIRAALEAGEPFQPPLDRLAQDAGVPVPEGLAAAAASGAPTLAALRAGFSDAAHPTIRATIQAGAGEGVVARSRAFLEAQVASRSLAPREGATPDAILSRMEDALRRDDLDAALAEAEALPSEAQAALGAWLAEARLRAQADAGLDALDASVAALN